MTLERARRHVRGRAGATSRCLAFDSRRYVGAQIGIHNPTGEKVGTVSHLHNTELVVLAGPSDLVRRAIERSASPNAVIEPLNVTVR